MRFYNSIRKDSPLSRYVKSFSIPVTQEHGGVFPGYQGRYNPATRQYERLEDHRIRLEVRKGLAIARKERAPDLVILPVPGPEPLE